MSEQRSSIDIRLYSSGAVSELAERVWPCYRDLFGDSDGL